MMTSQVYESFELNPFPGIKLNSSENLELEGESLESSLSLSEESYDWIEPKLVDLIVQRNWHRAIRVAARLQSIPPQASATDPSTSKFHQAETPLHVACRHRPPVHLIRALIQAFPEAVITRCTKSKGDEEGEDTGDGAIPLQLACQHHASLAVITALTRNHPETVLMMNSNRSSYDGNRGCSALSVLWQEQERCSQPHRHPGLLLQKSTILLEAVARQLHNHKNTDEDDDEELHLVLHAALTMRHYQEQEEEEVCPMQILEHVLEKHKYQASLKDRNGWLPLHIAVKTTAHGTRHSARHVSVCNNTIGKHTSQQHIINKLLAAYPEAARELLPTDEQAGFEQTPLYAAIASGHTWHLGGVAALFAAAPESVRQPCSGTEDASDSMLYPFQRAACAITPADKNEKHSPDLSTIYHLIREQPSVLQDASSTVTVITTTDVQKRATMSLISSSSPRPPTSTPQQQQQPSETSPLIAWDRLNCSFTQQKEETPTNMHCKNSLSCNRPNNAGAGQSVQHATAVVVTTSTNSLAAIMTTAAAALMEGILQVFYLHTT